MRVRSHNFASFSRIPVRKFVCRGGSIGALRQFAGHSICVASTPLRNGNIPGARSSLCVVPAGKRHDFQQMLNDPNPSLQRAALILLDQQQTAALVPEAVISRALHSDPRLAETARAILVKHPEYVEQTLPLIRQLLASNKAQNANALGEFVSLFGWHPAISSELADAIVDKTTSSDRFSRHPAGGDGRTFQ